MARRRRLNRGVAAAAARTVARSASGVAAWAQRAGSRLADEGSVARTLDGASAGVGTLLSTIARGLGHIDERLDRIQATLAEMAALRAGPGAAEQRGLDAGPGTGRHAGTAGLDAVLPAADALASLERRLSRLEMALTREQVVPLERLEMAATGEQVVPPEPSSAPSEDPGPAEWTEAVGRTASQARERALERLGVDDADAEVDLVGKERSWSLRRRYRVRARARRG